VTVAALGVALRIDAAADARARGLAVADALAQAAPRAEAMSAVSALAASSLIPRSAIAALSRAPAPLAPMTSSFSHAPRDGVSVAAAVAARWLRTSAPSAAATALAQDDLAAFTVGAAPRTAESIRTPWSRGAEGAGAGTPSVAAAQGGKSPRGVPPSARAAPPAPAAAAAASALAALAALQDGCGGILGVVVARAAGSAGAGSAALEPVRRALRAWLVGALAFGWREKVEGGSGSDSVGVGFGGGADGSASGAASRGAPPPPAGWASASPSTLVDPAVRALLPPLREVAPAPALLAGVDVAREILSALAADAREAAPAPQPLAAFVGPTGAPAGAPAGVHSPLLPPPAPAAPTAPNASAMDVTRALIATLRVLSSTQTFTREPLHRGAFVAAAADPALPYLPRGGGIGGGVGAAGEGMPPLPRPLLALPNAEDLSGATHAAKLGFGVHPLALARARLGALAASAPPGAARIPRDVLDLLDRLDALTRGATNAAVIFNAPAGATAPSGEALAARGGGASEEAAEASALARLAAGARFLPLPIGAAHNAALRPLEADIVATLIRATMPGGGAGEAY
jgi:hypothetical protein